MPSKQRNRIVIGVGNPDRGDDAAGWLVAESLAADAPGDIEVVKLPGEATEILNQLQDAEAAILVDASSSAAPAGTLQRFDVAAEPLPRALFAVSTHGVGLADAIELARALGDLPQTCTVFAIEGECFDAGQPLSAPVAAAVTEAAARVRAELQGVTAREGNDA